MSKKTPKEPSVEEIIKKTVDAALEAGRRSAEKSVKNAFKDTERRLYEYTMMKQRLEDDKERLEELERYGPRGRSHSVGRFVRSGVRLTPEEIYEYVHGDMEAVIKSDMEEIETIQRAISRIENDRYAYCVFGKYFDEEDDKTIAEKLGCDSSTVWRNRKRLVQHISVLLYGADALR